jgi:hypothetical protein
MSYPSWYAVEKIDEAIEDTKDFLLPFELGTWTRMAVIVILTGGFISGLPTSGPSDVDSGDFKNTTFEEDLDAITEENSEIDIRDNVALAVIGLIGGTLLLFSYISSVFQFIFFRSVDMRKAEIRKGFKTHWFDGLKYTIYQGVMMVAWVTTLLIPLATIATESILAVLTAVIFTTPIWIALYLVSFSVGNYTVPQMSTGGSGFIKSTLDGLQSFRREWKQAGIFLFVKIALGIAVAAISGIVNLAALIMIGMPVAIISFLVYAVNPVIAVFPVLIGVICLALVSIGVSIPLRTYMVQWVLSTYRGFK